MSASARSRRLRPNSSATPHSVTTVRTWARVVTTPAPCRKLEPLLAADDEADVTDDCCGTARVSAGERDESLLVLVIGAAQRAG